MARRRSLRSEWVLLAYRLPREPSTPRIALWRRLRRLGALQLLDGLVALPMDSRNREQLEWLADDVSAAGGESMIWIAAPENVALERDVVERMTTAVAAEYAAVLVAAHAAASGSPSARRRSLARLRRELRRIAARDYFPPPERELARQAVESLAGAVEVESAVGNA